MNHDNQKDFLIRSVPKRGYWIVAGAMTLVGILAFGFQIANLTMAGTSQYPWGLYIALFYTLASVGAGLLIVGGIGKALNLIPVYALESMYALACAAFVGASVLIVVDLGFPQSIMLTYVSANIASPVFFDAVALPLCIAFTIVAALFVRSGSTGKALALVGVAAGLALLAIEAWLLTTCSGKVAWGILLGAGPALMQSSTLAFAIMVMLGSLNRVWCALLAGGSLLTVASLVFDVVLNAASDTVLGNQFAAIAAHPLFWIAAILGLATVLLIWMAPANSLLMRISAGLTLVAIPLFKLAIFWGTQSVTAIAELSAPHAPSFDFVELLVFVGVVGIGLLVFGAASVVIKERLHGASQTAENKEVHA